MTTDPTPPALLRDQLLHAIDFAYTTGVLGYGTPEELLAAYDASRTPPPADRAELDSLGREADRLRKAWGEMRDRAERIEAEVKRMRAEVEQWRATFGRDALPGALRRLENAEAGRAAVLRDAADRIDREDLPQDDVDMFDNGARWATKLLRRMADETATTEPHACDNCEGVDPNTCFNNPNRPPEQCPRSEFEDYGQQCQKPAGHNLCSFEEQPAAGARQGGAQR